MARALSKRAHVEIPSVDTYGYAAASPGFRTASRARGMLRLLFWALLRQSASFHHETESRATLPLANGYLVIGSTSKALGRRATVSTPASTSGAPIS